MQKSMKSALAAAIVAFAISTNPSLASTKSSNPQSPQDPEVPVMKGVTKTKQYGFMFRRHPLLIGVHALEVQGGTIMLKNEKLTDYREKDGPLVGFYCYSGDKNGTPFCYGDEASEMSMEKYAESIGLRPYVRYNNSFQDPYGNPVEAIIGCAKTTPLKVCQDY